MTAEILKYDNCDLHELSEDELDGITGGFFPVIAAAAGAAAPAVFIAIGALATVGVIVVGASIYSIAKHAAS